jgi:hypothetical protein
MKFELTFLLICFKKWLMKKFTLILLALFVSRSVSAGFEFETMRTEEVPGFFLVRIFPDYEAQPLNIQNVFVKNYVQSEAPQYESLFPIIEEMGGLLVERNQLANTLLRADNRVIILGKSIQNQLSFQADDSEENIKNFQTFAQEKLQPIYLQKLETKFGGNVSEVYSNTKDLVGENPIIIVGKFETERRTRMEISGITPEGELRLSASLDLDDPNLSRPQVVREIPQVWEEFFQNAQKAKQPEKNSIFSKLPMLENWKNTFPILLGFLGILILVFAFKSAKKKYQSHMHLEELDDSVPLSTAQPQTFSPKAPEKPPFEVE